MGGSDDDDFDSDGDGDGPGEVPEVVTVELGDELDLHTFAPGEVKELVRDWLDECAARGRLEVRLVHGKGTGTLRRIVHGVLERHPAVARYALADERRGGWGATIVVLSPPPHRR